MVVLYILIDLVNSANRIGIEHVLRFMPDFMAFLLLAFFGILNFLTQAFW